MKRSNSIRLLSFLMAAVMIFTYLPRNAQAAEDITYPYAVVDTEAGTVTIDGTLGGKSTATEEEVNALVEQLKYYVDNGLTTIIVTGSEPALIYIDYLDLYMPAVSEALYRLTNEDSTSAYCGKIDLILPDVTEIRDDEFNNTFALNSITLPKVTTVGDGAFYATVYLQKLTFGSVITFVNEKSSGPFHMDGYEVGGCDLVLNCGQLQAEDKYKPNFDANVWFVGDWSGEYEWKSITLTHTEATAATCTTKATCSVCGESYGEVLSHNWVDGICTCCDAECAHSFESGICTVCGEFIPDAVATLSADGTVIGAYATMDEAVAAAIEVENSTILVLENCMTGTTDVVNCISLNIESGTFTIDLGGKTVDGQYNYAFRIYGGNVTFTDSVGGGKVTEDIGVDDNATVTIEGGEYETVACYDNGTLIITGGMFEEVYTNYNTTTLCISGGSFAELSFFGNHSFDRFLADGYRYYDAEGYAVNTSAIQPDGSWYYLYDVTVKDENPFTDVAEDSFYYEPVMWALDNGITTGATETTFNPGGTCLRAHVVTFLHRTAGNPAPGSDNNPFSDVSSSDFFYNPVLWAVENGITNGMGDGTFGAYSSCNRAAVVTFLWRAAGCPEPTSTYNPFVDVNSTDFFYKAVLWAVENGITTGVDETHFAPGADCNRAMVVTFLYRAMA